MIKRILYLVLLALLSLSLVESIRNEIAEKFVYPVLYNIGVSNNNGRLILASGKIKQYVRNFDEAKAIYTFVIKDEELSKQKNVQELAYLYLGDNFYAKADYTNAVKAYYLALKKNPINTKALLMFVRINLAYGNGEQILPVVMAYVAKRPNDAYGYGELCAVYNSINEYYSGSVNCQMSIKNSRNYARAHYDYSVALDKIGFKKDAEKELKLAKKIQPNIKSREEIGQLLRTYKANNDKN